MKSGWQTTTLAEACQFTNGLWKGEKPPYIKVRVIRNTNFTREGTLDDSDIAHLDVEERKFDSRRLQAGDIILEKSGGGPKQPVGRVALFDKEDEDYSFSNFTAALRVREPGLLDYRFVHKFLYWTYVSGTTEAMQSHSTGIRNLDADAYKALKIAFPVLAEQQRIVEALDEAFGGVATARVTAERNLLSARALFENHLSVTFEDLWKTYELVSLADLALGVTDGDHLPPPKASSGVPFITIGNIDKATHKIDFSNTFNVPHKYFNQLKDLKRPQRGDVLYTVTGSFGIPVIVDGSPEFCFQRHIGLIRPKLTTDSAWLYYLLRAPQVQRQAAEQATGTAQRTVSLKVLREFVVPSVPLVLQRRLAAALDAFASESQRLEAVYRRKLAALDELKKSLLHQAFTGQL